jgi:hypothetical protein
MHRIKNMFSTVKALGAYSIILAICVTISAVTTLASWRVWLHSESIYYKTIKLALLEDTLYYYMVNENSEANYYIYAEDMQEPPEFLYEAREEITIALNELEMEEYGRLADEEFTFIDIIRTTQHNYEEAFEHIRSTMTTSDWTWDDITALQAEADSHTGALRSALQDWIFHVETARQEARQTLTASLLRATRYGISSLILLPFLALWAFARAGRITQPLLALTHSAIAIAGGHYHPALLEEFLDRSDQTGALARALDHLDNTATTRVAHLEAEIASLREQLHETRHRKFKPVRPARDAESVSTGRSIQ